ncbi:MAG: hypothetical protein A2V93_11995 [Ignavibacteria bacterium RBG_16_34_14]|nr:MAG: hypothetical protein A2V93_11995 [Ignavibacteria bacterium RBG_16_34_14]
MQNTKQRVEDVFADIIEKIQLLTASQQKFLQEMLSRHEKISVIAKRSLLRKSFGIWAERKDIKDSIEYVNEMRRGWEERMQRIKS